MRRWVGGLVALYAAALGLAGTVTRPARSGAAELGEADGAGGERRFGGVTFRQFVGIVAVVGAAVAAGGFLLVASGVVPIKASSGHWAVTAWFLHFSMARSVATHSIGIEPPPLDDAKLVAKGAGHYDLGCRPCHGSPELRHPRIPAAMTPHPPYLPPRIPEWAPEELFYVVKHGVKFTGMPSWPALGRDDEVWAMAAFLLALPELDVAEYRRLAGLERGSGGATAPDAVRRTCARCHAEDGLGHGLGAFPKLAGQKPRYLRASLEAYASGRRSSGIMQPIAAELRDEEIGEVVDYYAGLRPAPRSPSAADAAAVARGAAIADRGVPARGIPACSDCHGPTSIRRNPTYPELAGQYADYLVLQLELFHERRRGGTPYAHLMRSVTRRLRLEDMRDVAAYYESLGPSGATGGGPTGWISDSSIPPRR